MPDLVAFVRACLDEDERVARAAGSSHLTDPSITPRWRVVGVEFEDYSPIEKVELPLVDGEEWDAGVSWGDTGHDPGAVIIAAWSEDAFHIARHDPAQVLADVKAKRSILDEHGPKTTRYVDAPDEESCRRCGKYDEYPVPYPCPTVRLLAQPFAERPGWREEWAT